MKRARSLEDSYFDYDDFDEEGDGTTTSGVGADDEPILHAHNRRNHVQMGGQSSCPNSSLQHQIQEDDEAVIGHQDDSSMMVDNITKQEGREEEYYITHSTGTRSQWLPTAFAVLISAAKAIEGNIVASSA